MIIRLTLEAVNKTEEYDFTVSFVATNKAETGQQIAVIEEDKAAKTYVDVQLVNKRDVNAPVDLDELTPRTLAAIQEGEGASFNLLSIPRNNLITTTQAGVDWNYDYQPVANAALDVARFYELPCVDLYSESGISKFNAETYTIDGLHQNIAGGKRVANRVIEKLVSLSRV